MERVKPSLFFICGITPVNLFPHLCRVSALEKNSNNIRFIIFIVLYLYYQIKRKMKEYTFIYPETNLEFYIQFDDNNKFITSYCDIKDFEKDKLNVQDFPFNKLKLKQSKFNPMFGHTKSLKTICKFCVVSPETINDYCNLHITMENNGVFICNILEP